PQQQVVARDARVVDQDVQSAQLLRGGLDRRLDLGGLGDVALERDRAAADLGDERLEELLVRRDARDLRPGARERLGDLASDAAARPGDQRDPSRQINL